MEEGTTLRSRVCLPLLIMTMVGGCGFLYAVLDVPPLEFHQLKHSTFPSSSFQIRRGFSNVLRWLESLNSREDLLVLGQLLTQVRLHAHASTSAKHELSFAEQVATAASNEMFMHLCKLGLQIGLVLFLYRRRVLSKNRTIPTLCLCILSFICWKMTHTCLHEMLAPFRSSAAAVQPAAPRTKAFALHDTQNEVTASFLNALFVARYGSVCITNVILARAYQVYFCEPWPAKWKRVPAYLGSKNLALGTLFFAAAGVSAMSASSPSLRSLCEAAAHIEACSLVVAFGHFVFLHFQDKTEETRAMVKTANK